MDRYSLLGRLPIGRFKEPPPVVAVIRLAGVIGALGPLRMGLTLSGVAGQIERAFKLPRLKAVALSVNSPGGAPVQAALIGGRIRALAEEKEIPVIAFAEDVAASGGYWLACAADEIYADGTVRLPFLPPGRQTLRLFLDPDDAAAYGNYLDLEVEDPNVRTEIAAQVGGRAIRFMLHPEAKTRVPGDDEPQSIVILVLQAQGVAVSAIDAAARRQP